MKICAFTQGEGVSSARFRVRQYIPHLSKEGIFVDEFISKYSSYPPASKVARPLWGMSSLSQRIPSIIKSHKYDLTLLQRTFISKFVTLEKFTKSPRLLDVDDAIWVSNKSLSENLAKTVDGVICGNSFLAEEYSKWNSNISIIPTAVDTNRFKPISNRFSNEEIIIGWSGSSSGLKYVYNIENSLAYILNKYKQVKLRIVSDAPPIFNKISEYEFIKWTPSNEVSTIQTMDIGIMPLEDSIFERGKCSYKMLLYMSCAIPVVVSEVGMNKDILEMNSVGYGANHIDEWVFALEDLIENIEKREYFGENGRNVVIGNFSIENVSSKLARVLRENYV